MSDQPGEGPQGTSQSNRGIKRRDLLLSGSSALAAAATLAPMHARDRNIGGGATDHAAAPHRLHRGRRSRMEGRRISRLRHQDAEHRQAGAGWSAARTVLRSADVHADARGAADRSLPVPLRPANSGHSDPQQIWLADRRAAVAPGPQGGRLQDGHGRQVAPGPRRPQVLAPPARVRLPLRLHGGRDRLLHAFIGQHTGLVSQRPAGQGRGLRNAVVGQGRGRSDQRA